MQRQGWRRTLGAVERVGMGGRKRSLVLLAAFAHFHRDIRDEEHTEEAPGDDLEVEHDSSPAANRTLVVSADFQLDQRSGGAQTRQKDHAR